MTNEVQGRRAREAPGWKLVGRTVELARLHAALGRLGGGGTASALELVGEPGIGKTTLLDRLCREADERGCLVLRGRAAQLSREIPFQVFVDALDDHLGSVNPRLFEPLGQDARIELASIFPALSDLAEQERPAIDAERYRAYHAVRSLLRLLAARSPVVLVIDDLHWADAASQELVSFLLRRPPRGPMLLSLAYRRGEAPTSLARVMERAATDGSCERVEVGPLAKKEADELLDDALPDPELRSRAFEDSGGNPFYLSQLAAHPEALAAATTARFRGEGVPASVLASIRGELSALDEMARLVLQGAAVACDPFEPQLAATAAGIGLREALGRLDELVERELLRPTDSPRRMQFRHPLLWRAVYEGTPPGWRIGAHARVAARLREEGAPPLALVPHLEVVAEPRDEEAIAVLADAGRAALSRAPVSAVRWLRSAERLLPSGDGRRIDLLVPMAAALGSAGELEGSRDAMREALSLIPADAREARTKAAVGCATMEFLLHRKAAGERLLLDTLASLDDETSPEAAEIKLALGSINTFDLEHAAARAWCRQALEISRLRGLNALEAGATALLAYGEMRLGNVAASTALVQQAAQIVDPLPDHDVAEQLDALLWTSASALCLERFELGLHDADRGIAIARATGQGRWLSQFASVRVNILFHGGRISDARRACDDVVEMARHTGELHFYVRALCAAIGTMLARGELRQALAASDQAIELVGPATDRARGDDTSVTVHTYVARCLLAAGRPSASRRMYLEGCGGEELTLTEPVWKPRTYHDLTLVDVALGNIEAADQWAARSETIAEWLGLAVRRAWALQARAVVMLAQGRARDAARTALEASEASAEAGVVSGEGRALCLAGRALIEAGERDAAITQLERAVELLDDCGALGYRDEAARWLRKLGRHVHRPGRRGQEATGMAALSRREHEIADLVAAGKTNKEIAAELHLSVYTVQNHLRSVFAKLGVSRRAAVAGTLAGSS